MAYDGSLKFDTKIDSSGFTKGISSIKSVALSAVGAIGAAFASGAIVQGMISVGKEGIALASNLQEVQNVIDVTFGEGATRVNEFAKSAKASFGLSELAAKQYTGTMGAMLKSMGLSSDAVEDMSTSMTGLSGDFASFFNITTEEAFQKIRAGIAGETEPLRQLGINMSVANLEAYALSQGIDKTYASMTQAEQATLRYNYLMSVSSDAQGDFARTSDSYANSQRLATLAVDELKTAIGNRLLPIATKMQGVIRDLALEAATAFDERGIAGIADMISDKFPGATAAVSGLAAALGALLIIKTLTPLVVAFQTAQVQVALAMMGTTAAAVAESGALTLFEVVVAIVTGKLKGAAAAQALFNAAIAANPVMLAVAALGALVATIVLVQKGFEKTHPEIYETRDAIDALNKSIDESRDSYDDTLDRLEKQRASSEALISTLTELSAGYSGSTVEQTKMQAICDELNGAYDGLSVTFDANTGKLSKNADAIREVIAAQIEAARTTAMMDRYTQILTDIANAEYELKKAQKEQTGTTLGALDAFAPWNAAAHEANDNVKRLEESLAALDIEQSDFAAILDEMGITMPGVNEEVETLTESTEELTEAQERVILGGEDVTQVLEDTGTTADAAAARLDNFTGAATNMFERISTRSKYTVKQMIANLVANTATIEQWGENIAILGEKLPESLLQPLIDQGPEKMAGVVQTLAKASDEELAALVAAFEDGGTAAMEAWYASLGAGTDEPPQGTVGEWDTSQYSNKKEMVTAILGEPARAVAESDELNTATETAVTDAKAAMEQAVTDSDFGAVGKEITSAAAENLTGARQLFYDAGRDLMMGFIIGMLSRKAEIEADARMLARAANDAFNDAIEVASPSKATIRSGKYFGQGFINGMRGQREPVAKASSDLAQSSLVGLRSTLTAQTHATYGAGLFDRAYKTTDSVAGTTINAPITVQGVVESDAKLARRVRNEFQEVVLYGNR